MKIFMITLSLLLASQLMAQPEFRVTKKGSGQPVLLLPGFTCTAEVWQDIETTLTPNHELHLMTFAGFGDTTPISFPWLPQIKEALLTYVEENKLHKPVIIGHSMGGTLALWLAADHPDVFSKVIVVDGLPAMGALMMPNYDSEKIAYETPYNKQMLEMDTTAFKNMATQMAGSMTLNKAKVPQLTEWILQADRETYVYGYTDLLKLDLREDLSNITIPVTILAATHPYGKEMAEATYNSQYKQLKKYDIYFAENAGHFIMFDQPEWFKQKIASELEK